MCWMVAIPIAMAAAQGLQSSMQGQQAAAAGIDQGRRQQAEMIKQMNYTDANLNMESRDLLDSTVQEMTQQNMNRVRNMGTIRAAIGEGNIEGNSMDRIQRVTEGDFLREQQGLTDNYQRDYSAILGKRYGNQEQTMSKIKDMQANEPKLKGKLEMMLDPLGLGLGKVADLATVGAFGTKGTTKKALGAVQKSDAKSTGSK